MRQTAELKENLEKKNGGANAAFLNFPNDLMQLAQPFPCLSETWLYKINFKRFESEVMNRFRLKMRQ